MPQLTKEWKDFITYIESLKKQRVLKSFYKHFQESQTIFQSNTIIEVENNWNIFGKTEEIRGIYAMYMKEQL